MYLPCKAYIYDKVPSFFFPVKLLALENYFTHTRFKAQPFSLIFSLFVQLQTTGQQKNTEATFASVF